MERVRHPRAEFVRRTEQSRIPMAFGRLGDKELEEKKENIIPACVLTLPSSCNVRDDC